MDVARYDPFDLLEGVVKSMLRPSYEMAVAQGRFGSIPVDVFEDDTRYTVFAELPGVKKDDVTIQVERNALSISAEVKRENAVDQGQGKERMILNERRFGSLSRTLELGAEIDDSKAEATYRDGVLMLKLPKSESAQPKRLTIH